MTDEMRSFTYTLHWMDWAVLAGYAVAIAAVGIFFARRQKSSDHYFTASGRIPGWAAGFPSLPPCCRVFFLSVFPDKPTRAADESVVRPARGFAPGSRRALLAGRKDYAEQASPERLRLRSKRLFPCTGHGLLFRLLPSCGIGHDRGRSGRTAARRRVRPVA